MLPFISRILSRACGFAGLAPPRSLVVRLGALVILAAAILGLLLTTGPTPPTQATTADIGFIGIDTDITGNTVTPCTATSDPNLDYPCNNSTVLGPIDSCRSIAIGQSIQIDVVGMNIPAGGTNGSNLSGAGAGYSDMALDWTPSGLGTSPIAVTARDFTVALIHQGDDDGAVHTGTDSVGTNVAGESGHWRWSDVDVNPDLVGEGGPGIAVRLTIEGMLPGVANLSLGANLLLAGRPTWTDITGNVGDEYTVGSYGGAEIFVGSPCPTTPTPSPQPVGGIVGLTVSNSGSSVPWTLLAAVAAIVMAVFGAGLWYGRRRWLR